MTGASGPVFGDSALVINAGGLVVRDASSVISACSSIAGDTAPAIGIGGLVIRDIALQLVPKV